MTDTMTLNYGTFEPLAFDEMQKVDGGSWQDVALGVLAVAYLPATYAVASAYVEYKAVTGLFYAGAYNSANAVRDRK